MLGTKATRTTKATRCPTKNKAELEDFKKSQFWEDEKLLGYFNGLCGGSYIEMGALDGLRYSNSHVFNKALGWKGLLVELSPSNYEKLVKNRRNEIAVVHAAVCANHQTVHYMATPKNSAGGIWEFAAPSFRKKWWKDVSVDALPTIECSPLKDLIVEHVAKEAYFDFLSLDIEGAELIALQSIDFTKVGFGIILVEARVGPNQNLKDLALRLFLENQGYVFLEDYNGSYWFCNSRFGEIYSHLLEG
jgi:FkbM family methyltransferase